MNCSRITTSVKVGIAVDPEACGILRYDIDRSGEIERNIAVLTADETSHLTAEQMLKRLFGAALQAALPDGKFEGALPPRPRGRTIVIGAGKAAASMAQAFEKAWGAPCEGLVITRYGHATPTKHIRVVEAAHPIPDSAGLAATRTILDLARAAGSDDLVVVLVSGGASSLLTMPIDGITLADKQELSRRLLRCGAPISSMNTVRKAISAIKGGGLAFAAAPAHVVTYIISDVPGDDPAIIGSGPSIPSSVNLDSVQDILQRYDIRVPEAVERAILNNTRQERIPPESEVHIIATPMMSLQAASREAQNMGVTPVILGDAIEGEAREVASAMGAMVKSISRFSVPFAPPCVLLSGGETTVTLKRDSVGRGGRNTEFLLSLYISLSSHRNAAAIACDTDGIDGSGDNAGAWFDMSLNKIESREALRLLDKNDAYSFFDKVGNLITTGPTYTNVNDFRAILVT